MGRCAARAAAAILLATGALASLADVPTFALQTSFSPPVQASFRAASHGQLLQVQPAASGIPGLAAGQRWQGVLFAVKVGRDRLPVSASAGGQLAGLLRLGVAAADGDTRLVTGEMTAPEVGQATVYGGTVALSVGNGFDRIEMPLSVSVEPAAAPEAEPSAFQPPETGPGAVQAAGAQPADSRTAPPEPTGSGAGEPELSTPEVPGQDPEAEPEPALAPEAEEPSAQGEAPAPQPPASHPAPESDER